MKKRYKVILIAIAGLLLMQAINWFLSYKAEDIVKAKHPYISNIETITLPFGYHVSGEYFGPSCEVCDDMSAQQYNAFIVGGMGFYKSLN